MEIALLPKQAAGLINRTYKAWHIHHAARKNELIWVLKSKLAICAIARVRPIENSWLLLGLASAPETRNIGYASRLIAHICQQVEHTPLFCFANTTLQPWYLKRGWQVISEQQLPPALQAMLTAYRKTDSQLTALQHSVANA